MSQVLVTAGIAVRDGRLLLLRRPEDGACPGLWEFPGGKIESGETPFDALVREWIEEIGVTVAGAEPFAFSTGDAGGRPLILLFYKVTAFSGEPAALLPGSSLRWSPAEEAALLAMPAPDAPVLASLIREGNGAFKGTETPDAPRLVAERFVFFTKRPARGAPRLRGILVDAGDAVRAWENVCPHVPIRLDRPGEEALLENGTIVCQQHGAAFDAGTGICTAGPCSGDFLRRLPLVAARGGWAIDWAVVR
jgi:8-oxo-dGTP diphosphatase